jgi:hypothetical protein
MAKVPKAAATEAPGALSLSQSSVGHNVGPNCGAAAAAGDAGEIVPT